MTSNRARAPTGRLPIAEEALAVARRTGGTVIRLHPLSRGHGPRSSDHSEPGRGRWRPLRNAVRIDRTQRQSCATTRPLCWLASLRVTRGEDRGRAHRVARVLRSYHDQRRTQPTSALSLGALAAALAGVDPDAALEFAAITESDAIAPLRRVHDFPELAPPRAAPGGRSRRRPRPRSHDVLRRRHRVHLRHHRPAHRRTRTSGHCQLSGRPGSWNREMHAQNRAPNARDSRLDQPPRTAHRVLLSLDVCRAESDAPDCPLCARSAANNGAQISCA